MRRSLFDTHTYLWFVADDPRLPRSVKSALEEPGHRLFLSVVGAFEIAIKHGLGKLPLDVSLEDLLGEQLEINEIELLSLRPAHLVAYAALPFPPSGHRDPFDRILVAQSQVEGLALVTGDRAFAEYGLSPQW